MNSKTLVFAVVSAAVVVMAGCATPNQYPIGADGKTQVDCRKTPDCQVELAHSWWKTGYPDEVLVNVPAGGKVTITWTIKGNDGTTFNQDGGINLKDAAGQRIFSCMQDAQKKHVFSCYNTSDLGSDATYGYGIKTKGFLSGPDIDPVIKNGA
jgi:hypothetical protein